MISSWLQAFLLTQLLEIPIWWVGMGVERFEASTKRRLGYAALASALTHPYVWFVFPDLPGHFSACVPVSYSCESARILLSEVFAWGVEGGLLNFSGMRHAWRWSLAANGTSFGLGMLLT